MGGGWRGVCTVWGNERGSGGVRASGAGARGGARGDAHLLRQIQQSVDPAHHRVEHPAVQRLGESVRRVLSHRLVERLDEDLAGRQHGAPRAQRRRQQRAVDAQRRRRVLQRRGVARRRRAHAVGRVGAVEAQLGELEDGGERLRDLGLLVAGEADGGERVGGARPRRRLLVGSEPAGVGARTRRERIVRRRVEERAFGALVGGGAAREVVHHVVVRLGGGMGRQNLAPNCAELRRIAPELRTSPSGGETTRERSRR